VQIVQALKPDNINPAISNLLKTWGYVKDIVYKTPVTSLNDLKLRIVAAIEMVTP
jgi:hypothetical protein